MIPSRLLDYRDHAMIKTKEVVEGFSIRRRVKEPRRRRARGARDLAAASSITNEALPLGRAAPLAFRVTRAESWRGQGLVLAAAVLRAQGEI